MSWRVETRARAYFAWLLILQTAVMGVFLSLDLVLFFIFWEVELAPMYFLISIWGTGRREYSAMKFLIYTFLGSAFMFAAIIAPLPVLPRRGAHLRHDRARRTRPDRAAAAAAGWCSPGSSSRSR